MAIIAGTTVNWGVSPRIITIPLPETSASIVDLQDTLQDLEDSEIGVVFPKLRVTTGGQTLDGGTSVGWTMELNNAQLQFAGRTTPIENGAVSSNDTTGTFLNASGALFVTNGVERGNTVFNNVTGSMATVLSVTDENNLVSQVLNGGARTTWLNTDTFSVYPNTQCSITGGNLVALDEFGASMSPALQSPNTNIIRTSSSSATISNQEQLESGLFRGRVVVDATGGVAGTGTALNGAPIGTQQAPSNNMTDALAIAIGRGITEFFVISALTLTSTDYTAGYVFRGKAPTTIVITVNADALVFGCEFQHCIVQGTLDGSNVVRQSIILDLTVEAGTGDFFQECALNGTVTLSGGTSINFWNCNDNFAGDGPSPLAIVDCGGAAGVDVIFRKYNGVAKLTNCTSAIDASLDVPSGRIIIDSTVTAGNFTIRGAGCEIIHTQTGAEVVDDKTGASLVWEKPADGTFTMEEVMKLIAAALAGKSSKVGSVRTFRDVSDTKDVITATVTETGDRTAITTDVS